MNELVFLCRCKHMWDSVYWWSEPAHCSNLRILANICGMATTVSLKGLQQTQRLWIKALSTHWNAKTIWSATIPIPFHQLNPYPFPKICQTLSELSPTHLMQGSAPKKVKPRGEVLLGTHEVGWKQKPPESGMDLAHLLLHHYCMHSSRSALPVPQIQILLCHMTDHLDSGQQFQLQKYHTGWVVWKASLLQVHWQLQGPQQWKRSWGQEISSLESEWKVKDMQLSISNTL